MRYHTYTDNEHVVVVTSTYAGKTVRGVAKCSPNDKFDICIGENLAKARCDYKIEKLRTKRAYTECKRAMDEVNRAEAHQKKMENYLIDSYQKLANAKATLHAMEDTWS